MVRTIRGACPGVLPAAPGSSNKFDATFSDPDVAATIKGFNGSGSVEVIAITIVDGR